ncbi:MAG: sarcosine oxidase subunit gamma family protein [Xanthobacteraceae bacterium]|nr:sarcosine oxidase subunit gamma family protein [Xanthobacteraceae bacterium]
MLNLASKSAFATLRSASSGKGVVAAQRVGMAVATVMVRRGRAAALADTVRTQFGIELPTGPHWTAANGTMFLGVGPGKWLVINDAQNSAFVQELEDKLQGLASVVEQSGGLGILRLTGPALHETLEKGVQIDLAPAAFPPGSVAVTSIAHVGATLWKLDDAPIFEIAVARSLSTSFFHWLDASASARGLSTDDRPD